MRFNIAWLAVGFQTTAILFYIFSYQNINKYGDVQQIKCHLKEYSRMTRLEKLSNYNESVFERLEELISRKAGSRDPELIQLVRELMDPPATSHPMKLSRFVYKTPQAKEIDKYLKGMEKGFYVEVGGYDGERSSNSIFFEAERRWRGLLIEADVFFYTQLVGKNRRCWSINACLSPSNHVDKLRFKESNTGKGKVSIDDDDPSKGQMSFFSDDMVVPCFPLETMLLAIDETRVDFFSLDVEGVELEILKSINFDTVNIKTLAVEYTHGNASQYKSFMEDKGYEVIGHINVADSVNFLFADDFIFAKQEGTSQP